MGLGKKVMEIERVREEKWMKGNVGEGEGGRGRESKGKDGVGNDTVTDSLRNYWLTPDRKA